MLNEQFFLKQFNKVYETIDRLRVRMDLGFEEVRARLTGHEKRLNSIDSELLKDIKATVKHAFKRIDMLEENDNLIEKKFDRHLAANLPH